MMMNLHLVIYIMSGVHVIRLGSNAMPTIIKLLASNLHHYVCTLLYSIYIISIWSLQTFSYLHHLFVVF